MRACVCSAAMTALSGTTIPGLDAPYDPEVAGYFTPSNGAWAPVLRPAGAC